MSKKLNYDEQSRKKLYNKKTKRSSNANGWFDKKAIRAETLASTLQRRGNPPHWSLEKILDLVEQIQGRNITLGMQRSKDIEKAKRAQENAIKRCWDAYYIILNTQVMYPGMDTQDESWNGAKMGADGKFHSEPLTYMPTGQLESFYGALKHGDKAKGRTTPKIYSSETWGISDEE